MVFVYNGHCTESFGVISRVSEMIIICVISVGLCAVKIHIKTVFCFHHFGALHFVNEGSKNSFSLLFSDCQVSNAFYSIVVDL